MLKNWFQSGTVAAQKMAGVAVDLAEQGRDIAAEHVKNVKAKTGVFKNLSAYVPGMVRAAALMDKPSAILILNDIGIESLEDLDDVAIMIRKDDYEVCRAYLGFNMDATTNNTD